MINVFKAYLTKELVKGGSDTIIYLDTITTLTGETVATSHFSTLGRGILSVNPDGDGKNSYPEYISFEAVSGTTLTGATRGLSALDNTEVTANKRYHPVGTPVVISVGVHNVLDILSYVNDATAALVVGAASVVTGTAGETLSQGDFVYLKNDGKWWQTDADTSATINGVQLGIAQGAGVTDAAITNGVMTRGLDNNQTGLVAGTTYYYSNTAADISSSAGTFSRVAGVAKSSTAFYFDPLYVNQLTTEEKADVLTQHKKTFTAGETIAQGDAVYMGSENTHYADFEASSSNYFTAADSAELSHTGDFSFETYINLESSPSSGNVMAIMSKWLGTGNQKSYRLRYENVAGTYKIRLATSSDGTNTNEGEVDYTLTPGTWYHLALTYDASAGTAEVYIDGSNEGTMTGLHTSIFNSTAKLHLGAWSDNGTVKDFLDGKLDDARMWSDIRTSGEVSANYQKELTGAEAGLVAYWKLNNALADSSTNSNTLTNVNSTAFGTSGLPFSGAGTVFKTQADTTGMYEGFVGFADEAIASASTGEVIIGGVFGNATSLIQGDQYYLSDTAGEISTTAGSNTRKVGIAVSSTELLITNIW